jgi:hypothetical protein
MPIPVLSHLQISWKRKFGLMLLFAVGSLYVVHVLSVPFCFNQEGSACITSMIRLKAVAVAINATDLTSQSSRQDPLSRLMAIFRESSTDCNLVLHWDEYGNHMLLSPAAASFV